MQAEFVQWERSVKDKCIFYINVIRRHKVFSSVLAFVFVLLPVLLPDETLEQGQNVSQWFDSLL